MSQKLAPKIPDGMVDLMKNLAKSVLREQPENIYLFAAEYFENLVRERDGSLDKGYETFRQYEKNLRIKKDSERQKFACDENLKKSNVVAKMDSTEQPLEMEVSGVTMRAIPRDTKISKVSTQRKNRLDTLKSVSQDSAIEDYGKSGLTSDSQLAILKNESMEMTKSEKSIDNMFNIKQPVENAVINRSQILSLKNSLNGLEYINEESPSGINTKREFNEIEQNDNAATPIIQGATEPYIGQQNSSNENAPDTPTIETSASDGNTDRTVNENLQQSDLNVKSQSEKIEPALNELNAIANIDSPNDAQEHNGDIATMVTRPSDDESYADIANESLPSKTLDKSNLHPHDSNKIERLNTPESDSGLSEKSFNFQIQESDERSVNEKNDAKHNDHQVTEIKEEMAITKEYRLIECENLPVEKEIGHASVEALADSEANIYSVGEMENDLNTEKEIVTEQKDMLNITAINDENIAEQNPLENVHEGKIESQPRLADNPLKSVQNELEENEINENVGKENANSYNVNNNVELEPEQLHSGEEVKPNIDFEENLDDIQTTTVESLKSEINDEDHIEENFKHQTETEKNNLNLKSETKENDPDDCKKTTSHDILAESNAISVDNIDVPIVELVTAKTANLLAKSEKLINDDVASLWENSVEKVATNIEQQDGNQIEIKHSILTGDETEIVHNELEMTEKKRENDNENVPFAESNSNTDSIAADGLLVEWNDNMDEEKLNVESDIAHTLSEADVIKTVADNVNQLEYESKDKGSVEERLNTPEVETISETVNERPENFATKDNIIKLANVARDDKTDDLYNTDDVKSTEESHSIQDNEAELNTNKSNSAHSNDQSINSEHIDDIKTAEQANCQQDQNETEKTNDSNSAANNENLENVAKSKSPEQAKKAIADDVESDGRDVPNQSVMIDIVDDTVSKNETNSSPSDAKLITNKNADVHLQENAIESENKIKELEIEHNPAFGSKDKINTVAIDESNSEIINNSDPFIGAIPIDGGKSPNEEHENKKHPERNENDLNDSDSIEMKSSQNTENSPKNDEMITEIALQNVDQGRSFDENLHSNTVEIGAVETEDNVQFEYNAEEEKKELEKISINNEKENVVEETSLIPINQIKSINDNIEKDSDNKHESESNILNEKGSDLFKNDSSKVHNGDKDIATETKEPIGVANTEKIEVGKSSNLFMNTNEDGEKPITENVHSPLVPSIESNLTNEVNDVKAETYKFDLTNELTTNIVEATEEAEKDNFAEADDATLKNQANESVESESNAQHSKYDNIMHDENVALKTIEKKSDDKFEISTEVPADDANALNKYSNAMSIEADSHENADEEVFSKFGDSDIKSNNDDEASEKSAMLYERAETEIMGDESVKELDMSSHDDNETTIENTQIEKQMEPLLDYDTDLSQKNNQMQPDSLDMLADSLDVSLNPSVEADSLIDNKSLDSLEEKETGPLSIREEYIGEAVPRATSLNVLAEDAINKDVVGRDLNEMEAGNQSVTDKVIAENIKSQELPQAPKNELKPNNSPKKQKQPLGDIIKNENKHGSMNEQMKNELAALRLTEHTQIFNIEEVDSPKPNQLTFELEDTSTENLFAKTEQNDGFNASIIDQPIATNKEEILPLNVGKATDNKESASDAKENISSKQEQSMSIYENFADGNTPHTANQQKELIYNNSNEKQIPRSKTHEQDNITNEKEKKNETFQTLEPQSNTVETLKLLVTGNDLPSSDLSDTDTDKPEKVFNESGVDETSRDERDEVSEIENFDLSSCGEDSLEAMYYMIRKNEIIMDKHKLRKVENENPEEEKITFPDKATDDLENAFREVSGKNITQSIVSVDSSADDVVVTRMPTDTDSLQLHVIHDNEIDSSSDIKQCTKYGATGESTDDECFNPILISKQRNENLLNQMHSKAKSLQLFDVSKTIDENETDHFPQNSVEDMNIRNIGEKSFASSLSEVDSDYFEITPSQKRLTKDDFNISTAFEHMLRTESTTDDSDSTIESAATKIQAGARGFLTRRRLRRSSAGTSASVEKHSSIGNAAIDKSLDDLAEQQEVFEADIENHKKTDDLSPVRHVLSTSETLDIISFDDTTTMLGITEVKMEKRNPGDCVTKIVICENSFDVLSQTDTKDVSAEDVGSTAQRRLTLQRGDAMQRHSTPDESESQLKHKDIVNESNIQAETEESNDLKSINLQSEIIDVRNASVIAHPQKSSVNASRSQEMSRWKLGSRQRSMPVQIETQFMRVLPKHKRKRIQSAGNASSKSKEKSN